MESSREGVLGVVVVVDFQEVACQVSHHLGGTFAAAVGVVVVLVAEPAARRAVVPAEPAVLGLVMQPYLQSLPYPGVVAFDWIVVDVVEMKAHHPTLQERYL